MKMNKVKTSRFNIDWLNRGECKDWLLPEDLDPTEARCKIYRKTFSLSKMGEKAVTGHAEGKKQASSLKLSQGIGHVSDFYEKTEVQTEKAAPGEVRESSSKLTCSRSIEQTSTQLTKLVLRKEQHKAEILWALKSVMSHFSLNSAQDIMEIFKAMFPDSNIVQGMRCGPTNLSYFITFGIAPSFRELLIDDLKKAPCFVILFDESLNTSLHQEQMDFSVRYFKDDHVVTRYLSSVFLGHTTPEDLKL